MNANAKKIGGRIFATLLALCMIFTICSSVIEHLSGTIAVSASSGISENAMKLAYNVNITSVTLSYLEGDNWIDITDDNNSSLPANASYQLSVLYHDISIQDLIDADYQIVYDEFPEWFVMSKPGFLLYDNEIAANIELIDGKIVFTFDKNWVDQHSSSNKLGGTFNLFGNIDWRNLPNNSADCRFPGLELDLNFEDDAAQKYGAVDIEKSEPNLVIGSDGKYYLEYEITVTSMETITMPDITVRDMFSNASYISGYAGIDDMAWPPELMPQESSDLDGADPGAFSKDGYSMVWDIGELGAGEVRTLKYYAQISDRYIDQISSNPIENRASVFSGTYQKDTDASGFVPQNSILLQKNAQDVYVDQKGNGYITYTVTVTADENNSFTLSDLVFKDGFPDDLKPYLSGDNGKKITVSVTQQGQTSSYDIDYSNASFELFGVTLAPGEEITIEYTVLVSNIFLYNNGEVELPNTATIGKGDRTLSRSSDVKTLQKINNVRKIYGSAIDSERTIEFGDGDSVYEYNGSAIVPDNDSGFTVPAGSHKYDVVLNESGNWDLSSNFIKDNFTDKEHIEYVGYVQIRLYERSGDGYNGEISNDDLLKELEGSEAVRTIWLNIDEMDEFSFKPSDFGIEGNNTYTYQLTYYAKTKNMDNVGTVQITNEFELWGDTIGDGNGTLYPFPGIKVSVGNVVQGGVKYDADKESWYYEPKDDVYPTEAIGKRGYPKTTWQNDYNNGAVYWIIRLTGDIKEGSATRVDENDPGTTQLHGFVIADDPYGANNTIGSVFRRDAIVGVFCGPKSFDITQYSSYKDFLTAEISEDPEADSRFTKLIGNPGNDKWFSDYFDASKGKAQYQWYANDRDLQGIIFPNGYELGKDKALYIVLRTVPNSLPSGNTAYRSYKNDLKIGLDMDMTKVPTLELVDTAYYTLNVKSTLHKESKGAYVFNETSGVFTKCSVGAVSDWNVNNTVGAAKLSPYGSGTYAAWLLNVNWDGKTSGELYVSDYLPQGMELAYVDVNNFGGSIKSNIIPKTGYIETLQGDPDWQEMTETQKAPWPIASTGIDITTITYYNPKTREIRWRVSDLTAGNSYNQYQINLRIICRVVDPELFLSGEGKTYYNNVAIIDPETLEPLDMDTADVTIIRQISKNLDEATLRDLYQASIRGGSITSKINRLPFKLEINPVGEDMSETDILPALIDELSEGLEVLENTIKVTKADGTPYTAFTYTVEINNGRQVLIIKNLPDNTPMTITYDARINAQPNVPVTVSNKAYWAGNPPPDNPQVKDKEFQYTPNGTVFIQNDISIEITKVDSASHSKRLQGAKFAVYQADGMGNLLGDAIESGTTDSYGNVIFENESTGDARFKFNTIYCIEEESAPYGYKLDTENGANRYYFIIIDANNPINVPDHTIDLGIWYDSPEYSITIENDKGTIGVEKVFQKENGEVYQQVSGRYRFGLYDGSDELLETLTIEYTTDAETGVTTIKYYLDDMPKSSPEFTKFEPAGKYYIYELDHMGKPLKSGDICEIEGITYKVTYGSDGSNEVYAGRTVTIINREFSILTLPASGGIGLQKYYITGAFLILISMMLVAIRFILFKKRKAC